MIVVSLIKIGGSSNRVFISANSLLLQSFLISLSDIFCDISFLSKIVLPSIWWDKGISKFFREQSNEEREHMLKICDYILECDETPIIPSNTFLELDELSFDNMLKIFEDSLFNEKEITNSFYNILIMF